MTKKELLEALKDVSDDAIVYTEADHGQLAKRARGVGFSMDDPEEDGQMPYYGNDMTWVGSRAAASATAVKIYA